MRALDDLPEGMTNRDAHRYFTWAWHSVWIITTTAALIFMDSWWWFAAVLAGGIAVGGASYARGYLDACADINGRAEG